ncbi:MAG: hypothetical protein HYW25_06040 [Candidatus Aenigmarchaeota archaeon]|nr:hypothetical protein [Candidatus Aenigmarchaeota archaeon]
MPFSAELRDIDILRESLSAIAEIIDETEIIIREDGIYMLAADRAVVAVVDFFLSRGVFSEYSFEGEQRIGMNLMNLLRILRRASPGDILRFTIEDGKMKFRLSGESVRTFSLPIIDVSKQEMPDLEKLSFASSFDISSEVLGSGIEDSDLITDSLVFSVSSDRVLMAADSDLASFNMELKAGSPALRMLNGERAARARYSLDYLKRIMKARRLSDTVKVQLGPEYPAKFTYDIPEKARLSFVVAPRRDE